MSHMRWPKLSIDDAEVLLARLWCRLEAEGLPSPEVYAEFDGDWITLTLLFPSRRAPRFAKSRPPRRRPRSTVAGHARTAPGHF
jgi:hypothetical protein